MKYSPHLTRFFASLPPKNLAPLLIEALSALGVKYKVKPPATVLVGGYDVRKEKFKGRVMLEGFKWKGVECSLVEMAREEVKEMLSRSCVELTLISREIQFRGGNFGRRLSRLHRWSLTCSAGDRMHPPVTSHASGLQVRPPINFDTVSVLRYMCCRYKFECKMRFIVPFKGPSRASGPQSDNRV